MDTHQISQLKDALQRGNLALFVGGDLPRQATGLPSRADLAAALARRLGLGGAPPPWPQVAAQYEAEAGLNALIRWLQDRYDSPGGGDIYPLLAQLPVRVYITTTYDSRLYGALRQAGRRPNLPVVDASSLGLDESGRPTVVKLFGTLDRPDSLVLTAAQVRRLPEEKRQILSGLVHPTLANRSVLLLGQDLRDPDFETLYAGALFGAGTIRPPAYVAWPGLATWQVQTWRRQEVWVLETGALDLVRQLLPELESRPETEESHSSDEGANHPMTPMNIENPSLTVVRDLLLAGFSAADLRRLFLYSSHPGLRALTQRFSPNDGLAAMVEKTVEYCQDQGLMAELLHEVEQANPRQYARFAPQLRQRDAQPGGTAPSPAGTAGPQPQARPAPPVLRQRIAAETQPAVYADFELLVGRRYRGSYPVQVIESPAGEGQATFRPPLAGDELQEVLERLERRETDQDFLADVGTRLFAALFSGDVRVRYAESAGLTGAAAGLRIRLRLDPPELQALPWELMRDPEKREFLVLSKRSLVTRYLHVPRAAPPLQVAPPLRVLVAVAAPQGWPRLDVEGEVARIREALAPLVEAGQVALGIEPHVTKRGLRQRIMDDAPHVLHYVGHGGIDGGRGVLLLEDEDGRGEALESSMLGILLQGSPVRLAVLNACLTAREEEPDMTEFPRKRQAFLGVGPALVDAGLGAVVAMQFSFTDAGALVLAQDLYEMMARRRPIDECVSRAREMLLLEVGLGRPDWATPVLFMRAPDGVVFQ